MKQYLKQDKKTQRYFFFRVAFAVKLFDVSIRSINVAMVILFFDVNKRTWKENIKALRNLRDRKLVRVCKNQGILGTEMELLKAPSRYQPHIHFVFEFNNLREMPVNRSRQGKYNFCRRPYFCHIYYENGARLQWHQPVATVCVDATVSWKSASFPAQI